MKITNRKTWRVPRTARLPFVKHALGVDTLPGGLKILDWGSNFGNLLVDGIESGEIDPIDYTGVDVDQIVLFQAAEEVPEATWIYRPITTPAYSRYLLQDEEDIELQPNFYDLIVVYSVFTHDVKSAMDDDLRKLYDALKPGGKLLMTYLQPEAVKRIFIPKRISEYGSSANPEEFDNISEYTYLINNDIVTDNPDIDDINDIQYFLSTYNVEWINGYVKNNFDFVDVKQINTLLIDKNWYHDALLLTK